MSVRKTKAATLGFQQASDVRVTKVGDIPHGYKVRASVTNAGTPFSTQTLKRKPKKKTVRESVEESLAEQCSRLVLAIEGSTLLKTISFDNGSMSPLNVLALEENWWYLRDNPTSRIFVRGHLDPNEQSADLALGRAQSVRAFFIQRGVEPARLVIAPGDRSGRRVDFIVVEQS